MTSIKDYQPAKECMRKHHNLHHLSSSFSVYTEVRSSWNLTDKLKCKFLVFYHPCVHVAPTPSCAPDLCKLRWWRAHPLLHGGEPGSTAADSGLLQRSWTPKDCHATSPLSVQQTTMSSPMVSPISGDRARDLCPIHQVLRMPVTQYTLKGEWWEICCPCLGLGYFCHGKR